jgi:hypothetical protein
VHGVQAGALDRLLDVHRQVQHPLSGQQGAGVLVEDRAAAEREDAVVLGERPPHGGLLDRPEGRLALVDEDLGDGPALLGDDVVVGVPVAHAEPLGEQLSDGGLAHPHRADQHDQRHRAHRTTRLSR